MPRPVFVFSTPIRRTVTLRRPDIMHLPSIPTWIQDQITRRIQHHTAVLQSMGIKDLATLGKLPISGNVIPQPGLLITPARTFAPADLLGPQTAFHSACRIPPGSTGASPQLEKMGGIADLLKVKDFPGTTAPRIQPSGVGIAPRVQPSGVGIATRIQPSGVGIATRIQPSGVGIAPRISRLFMPTPLLQIPVAYWAANEIEIADDTNILLLQPHRWLVIIANKITFGDNVTMTWEEEEKAIPGQPAKRPKLPDPPISTRMGGTDGDNGAHGDPALSGRGPDGDPGPEIEVWTLDINKLPSVFVTGQEGFRGGKGQGGQDGQDGAKGRAWIPEYAGLGCESGPGNGGDGGNGGNGARGGRGGDGGHGGRFNVYAPDSALLTIGSVGYYIDAAGGIKGSGRAGGERGLKGKGGKSGKDRGGMLGGCPTSYGKDGHDGRNGNPGTKGPDGNDGEHYPDAEKFYPITTDEFIRAFNKPAITDLSADAASVGDVVTAEGHRFTNTDKVLVDGVEAQTVYFSDTMLSFTVPQTIGGRKKAVVVKQRDGTLSNRATLHIIPKLFYAEHQGKKSTDRPSPRFAPGSNVTLIGTGFARDASVRVKDGYVSGAHVQYVDSTKLTFKLIRPSSMPVYSDGAPPGGEQVEIEVILPDGPESGAIEIILDTYVIAVFGDSIQWGQGLREDLKFHSLVANHVKGANGDIGICKTVLAHSGATIGVGDYTQLPPVDGEVPTSYPTIIQQVDAYPHAPELVDLILLDGGINDIGVQEIVSPIATSNLTNLAQQHCYNDMKVLLTKATQRFPNATIVVTGYYPIVTNDSDLSALILLLAGLGMLVGGLAGAIAGGILSASQKTVMVSRSNTLATQANNKLQDAVNDVNATLTGGARIYFADPNFGPNNAIFASNTWLWGIDNDLSPADDEQIGGVAPTRNQACEIVKDADPSRTSIVECKRASLGHPNVTGANKYARAINPMV